MMLNYELNYARLQIKWLPSFIIQKKKQKQKQKQNTIVWDVKPGCSNIPPVLDNNKKPHGHASYPF